MDDPRDCLAFYPFVVVRIACRVCPRRGNYRLARLAAKFGPEIGLRDLTDRFSYDCLWKAEARTKGRQSACGVPRRTLLSSCPQSGRLRTPAQGLCARSLLPSMIAALPQREAARQRPHARFPAS
jgi:hypothetical protein